MRKSSRNIAQGQDAERNTLNTYDLLDCDAWS